MISDRALDAAVDQAVLTRDQVERLRAIESGLSRNEPREPVDEESLRFVSGFADIFVTIGIVLFLGALGMIMGAGSGSTPALAGITCCAWLLAEFFTGKRRMALPSIVLLVVFVAATFYLSAQIFAAILPATGVLPNKLWFVPSREGAPLALAAIVSTALASLHYVRFRVPITIAAGAASLCILAISAAVVLIPNLGEVGINTVLFVCGLGVFALAMRFDMSDPERTTRRTDIAFWLHLLAAPLIVHPLVRGFLGGLDDRLTPGAAAGILWVFLALGVIAVIIDRRAILVSGLVYAGIAFGTLIKSIGFPASNYLVPTVLLTLGAFILLLSAGWLPLRRAILRRLPPPLANRLPHPLITSQT